MHMPFECGCNCTTDKEVICLTSPCQEDHWLFSNKQCATHKKKIHKTKPIKYVNDGASSVNIRCDPIVVKSCNKSVTP